MKSWVQDEPTVLLIEYFKGGRIRNGRRRSHLFSWESWIEEDKEDEDEEEDDSCREFSWSREMLRFAKLDEVEGIVTKVFIRKVIIS